MPIPPRTGVSGLRTGSPTTSASSPLRPCMVSSPPTSRGPTSCGRWHCSGRRTATAGAWVSRSSRRSPISCPCCQRRKPISPCSTARAAWRRTATVRRRGGNVRRWEANPIRPRSSAGCGVGHMCAIARRPSAPCSRRLRAVSRRLCLPMPCSRPRPSARSPTPDTRSISSTRRSSASTSSAGSMRQLCCRLSSARWWRPGAEESTAWRQPVDLVALCEEAANQLPQVFAAGRGVHSASQTRVTRAYGWSHHAALARELLGDDPARIVDALKAAIRAGAAPADLSRSLAYAAALRVARFGDANEHADWETAHHVFTYANAVDQMLKRIGTANPDGHVAAVRGVLHGAMALYLTRYLNVPPARIPGEGGEQLDDLPTDAEMIRTALLDAFDRQRQVDLAARLVARHLTVGHSPQALIATLAQALLREDAGFHAYQMLEAGVRQSAAWGDTDEGRHILIAVARYLAAHSPTERAALQTADIARRLMRGGELHQEAGAS